MPQLRGTQPAGSVVGPAATDRLRRDNTALVLRSLRDDGPASRAGLAARTGLAKATVGAIVTDLADVGAVREQDPEAATTGRLGRPGRPVALDGARTVGLGLEVNVDYLAATALDLSGRVVLSSQVPVRPAGASSADDALARLARDSMRSLRAAGCTVLGTTVAVPGHVDRASGVVVDAPNLHWHDRDVAAELAATLGAPLWVDNDANCAAAGEAAFGAARGVDHVLYLTGTVGIGAGLVDGGRVQRGAHGLAGEVGHAPLASPERRCACGRLGCWETAVGLDALVRETGLDLPDRAALDPVAVAALVAAGCHGDAGVRAGVERLASSLATGLAILAATLDPELVVLGGFFVPLGEWVLPVVTSRLAEVSGTRVELSTLGLHAASTGAAADVVGQVFAGSLALV